MSFRISSFGNPSSLVPYTISSVNTGNNIISGLSCFQAVLTEQKENVDRKTIFSSYDDAEKSGAQSICIRDGNFSRTLTSAIPKNLNIKIASGSCLTFSTPVVLDEKSTYNLSFSGPGTLKNLTFKDFNQVQLNLSLQNLCLEGVNNIKAGNSPDSYLNLVGVVQKETGSCIDITEVNEFTTLNIDRSNLALKVTGSNTVSKINKIYNSILKPKPGKRSINFEFTGKLEGLKLSNCRISSTLIVKSDSTGIYDLNLVDSDINGLVNIMSLVGVISNSIIKNNKIKGMIGNLGTKNGIILKSESNIINKIISNQIPSIILTSSKNNSNNIVAANKVIDEDLNQGEILFDTGIFEKNLIYYNLCKRFFNSGPSEGSGFVGGNALIEQVMPGPTSGITLSEDSYNNNFV
jgi:hypothetical protein